MGLKPYETNIKISTSKTSREHASRVTADRERYKHILCILYKYTRRMICDVSAFNYIVEAAALC